MTRTTFSRSAFAIVVVSLTLVSSGNAIAALGETPLSKCYNRVITICNQGDHPIECAVNAMDACDKEYGAKNGTMGLSAKPAPRIPGRLGLTMAF